MRSGKTIPREHYLKLISTNKLVQKRRSREISAGQIFKEFGMGSLFLNSSYTPLEPNGGQVPTVARNGNCTCFGFYITGKMEDIAQRGIFAFRPEVFNE